MLPQEIIIKKRENKKLSQEEINFFIQGITDGTISDAQTAALTMAIFLNGFDKAETASLTLAMRNSGEVLSWKEHPIIDKHSSGGVGDKVSLMLAPMLAACGGYVPMISGRGLGHTGGTLDKFDSIPGYNTLPDNKLFKKVVKEVGCAIIGQTGNLAPADKKIYAIRDVCGTVESIPLITASILSKKLAAGLDNLVMDLKCGNGAFMNNLEDARTLAKAIVSVANNGFGSELDFEEKDGRTPTEHSTGAYKEVREDVSTGATDRFPSKSQLRTKSKAGTKTTAIITDMNQVLGRNVGNAVEMLEAVEYLKGENIDPRLHEVNMELCAELLVSSKLAKNIKEAKTALQKSLDSGKALKIFAKMVHMLGGPKDFTKTPEKYLPKAKIIRPIYSKKSGYVESMNTREIGLTIIELKGGRTHPDQTLDFATGYTNFCQIGDKIDPTTPLAIAHVQTEQQFKYVEQELNKLIKISSKKPTITSPIIEKIK